MRKSLVAAAAVLLIGSQAFAAGAASSRLRGTIQSYDNTTRLLAVKTDSGVDDIVLLPDARIIANQKATIASIKPGDFVASAAVKAPNGKLYAQEVRIFPESMRGLGEGHYPMSQPNQSMTNATVEDVQGVSAAANTGTLRVTFHGTETVDGKCEGHASAPGQGTCTGETDLVVPPNIPVTHWVLGDPTWLQPGLAVTMFAGPGPKGGLVSGAVVVEHDGIKPHI